jgi:hypothetical protein
VVGFLSVEDIDFVARYVARFVTPAMQTAYETLASALDELHQAQTKNASSEIQTANKRVVSARQQLLQLHHNAQAEGWPPARAQFFAQYVGPNLGDPVVEQFRRVFEDNIGQPRVIASQIRGHWNTLAQLRDSAHGLSEALAGLVPPKPRDYFVMHLRGRLEDTSIEGAAAHAAEWDEHLRRLARAVELPPGESWKITRIQRASPTEIAIVIGASQLLVAVMQLIVAVLEFADRRREKLVKIAAIAEVVPPSPERDKMVAGATAALDAETRPAFEEVIRAVVKEIGPPPPQENANEVANLVAADAWKILKFREDGGEFEFRLSERGKGDERQRTLSVRARGVLEMQRANPPVGLLPGPTPPPQGEPPVAS